MTQPDPPVTEHSSETLPSAVDPAVMAQVILAEAEYSRMQAEIRAAATPAVPFDPQRDLSPLGRRACATL